MTIYNMINLTPSILLSVMNGVTLTSGFDQYDLIGIILVVILLFCSAFMSSSEVAFFSLSPTDLYDIKESDNEKDHKILKLLRKSEKLLATILIGNNIVNISIVLVTTALFRDNFEFSSPILAFLIQTVLLTFLLLLFGEIIPKVYAQTHPLQYVRSVATPITYISKLLNPFSKLLMRTGWLVNKAEKKSSYQFSVDELSKAVELTVDDSSEGNEMLNDIIRFYNKTADEIMVPRIDMMTINCKWDFKKMLDYAISTGFSRIPVYEGSRDTIIGILYVKDMLSHVNESDDFNWQKLVREAYFVPENKKLDDLLEEFRREHIHIAIVVDEYGGTSGLITMEDILEEIVGDIIDEYDDEEVACVKIAEGIYSIEGRTAISDVVKELNLDEEYFADVESDVDTLGGLFLEIKQEIPQIGEEVSYKDLKLKITQMDRHRIIQLKLTYKPQPKEDNDAEQV